MKKNGKSILAILMAAAMTVSMAPAPVFADTNENSDQASESSAAADVNSDGSASAENGSAETDSAVAAGEAAQNGSEAGTGENADAAGTESGEDAQQESADDDELVTDSENPAFDSGSITTEYAEDVYINPLYAGIIDESDLIELPEQDQSEDQELQTEQDGPYASTDGETSAFTSIQEAGNVLRTAMKNREATVELSLAIPYSEEDTYETVANQILKVAEAHTGNPTEGDYIAFQYGGTRYSCSSRQSEDTFYLKYTIAITYYTTLEQEAQVDEEVKAVLKELEPENKSDYQKVKATYDYICQNVTYDDEHVSQDDYWLQYTAYAALHNHTAVCQGYAVLLYRLLMEQGVEVRVISGIGNNGKHSWNIIKLGSWYYDADSTWDSQCYHDKTPYAYFLRSEENFGDHSRGDDYITEEFVSSHPMDVNDYDLDYYTDDESAAASSGTCGDNLTWTLDANGKLVISGTGDMADYSAEDPEKQSPWYQNSAVKSVFIKDGVTSVGAYAFYQCPNLTVVNLGYSVKKVWEYSFYSCQALRTVKLSSSLTTIGDCAFSGCTALTFVTNLASTQVSQIGKQAFSGCSSWDTSLELPASITLVAKEAFNGTASTEIYIPDVEVTLGDTFVSVGTTICSYTDSAAYKYWVNTPGSKFYNMHPSAPENVTAAQVSSTSIQISWDAVHQAEGYRIYRTTGDSKVFKSTVIVDGTSYTDTKLTTGTTYKYIIVPVNKYNRKWYEGDESKTVVCSLEGVQIVQQPQNCRAALKQMASFTVIAENAASYQWQYSKNGTKWYNSTAAGADDYVLVTTVSRSNSTNMYRCRITGTDGTVLYTDTAAIDLIPGAEITEEPATVCVLKGEKATFTITAENVQSYQWYYSKDGGKTWFKSTASGAQTDTFTVTPGTSNRNNLYRCKLTGTDGNTVTSATTGFVVIAAQPEDSMAEIGTTATFTVEADDNYPIETYKWYYSKDSGETWYASSLAGADTDTLSVKATSANRSNYYSCKVTSAAGVQAWTNVVGFKDAADALVITEQPESVSAAVGEKAVFAVKAENVAETGGYQWLYSKDGKTWYKSTASGNATDTLTITVSNGNKNNQYKCKLTGTDGTVLFTDIVNVQ